MTQPTLTQEQINTIVQDAFTEANKAAREALALRGDRDACGFAWVSIYGIKGSTKLGKMLTAAGVTKDWTGKAFQIWNPAKLDRKSTRLNSSHIPLSRMPSSA